MSIHEILSTGSLMRQSQLGLNSTVRDDVSDIESFRKELQMQKKQHDQIQLSVKKIEEQTKTSMHDMYRSLSERIQNLMQLLRNDCKHQNKQFEELQLQSLALSEQHDQLFELTHKIYQRTQLVDKSVGR